MKRYLLVVAIILATTPQVYGSTVCDAVFRANAFNTTDYSSSAKFLLKKRDDVCSKQYDSESEAKTAARSAGGSIGFKGFSLGGSAAKKNSNDKWSLSSSEFCRSSAAEIDAMTSETMRSQVTDLAVEAWRSCTEKTLANKLLIEYKQNKDGTGIRGRIIRSIASEGGGVGIGMITGIINNKPQVDVKCTIGRTSVKMNEEIEIRFDRTHTSFFCNKPANDIASISVNTSQGDQTFIDLYSEQEYKQAKIDEVNDSVTALRQLVDDVKLELSTKINEQVSFSAKNKLLGDSANADISTLQATIESLKSNQTGVLKSQNCMLHKKRIKKDWATLSCPAGYFIAGGGCLGDSTPRHNGFSNKTTWSCGGGGKSKTITLMCCK